MKYALPALLPLLLLSCGDNAADGSASPQGSAGAAGAPLKPSTGLPCDIDALMVSRCQQCHSDPPQFGAPMPLVTRDHLLQKSMKDPASTYAQRAVVRMKDASNPMPQAPNPPASEAEIALLDGWINAGTPSSAQGCNSPPPPGSQPAKLSCAPDVTLLPPSRYEMPETTDDIYICYGADLPGSPDKRHVIGLDARIDNSAITHHILVFEAPSSQPAEPHPCKDLFPADWKLIYAWAPGTLAYELPAEAGYPLEPGATTHYVVQIHYSNIKHMAGQSDATGVDVCTTKNLRPHDADLVAVGGSEFSIPARARSTHECSLPIPKGATQYFPITVFRAWPHMHQLGQSLSTDVVRPDGSVASLGRIDAWNFYNQVGYPINVKVNAGDTIVTRCSWNNTTDGKVGFGEATGDEMCYNFITYYPKANLQLFSGVTPAALSSCKTIE